MKVSEHLAQMIVLSLGLVAWTILTLNEEWGIHGGNALVFAWFIYAIIDWRAIRRLENENERLNSVVLKTKIETLEALQQRR